MKNYYGDVEIVARMRYRVSCDSNSDVPSTQEMFDILTESKYDDILDQEELEVLCVLEVGENAVEDSVEE